MSIGDAAAPTEMDTTGVDSGVSTEGVPLAVVVDRALRDYLEELDGEAPCDLYDQVLAEVEAPLLRVVMERVGGNQCHAARLLGLSRGTLRKKLRKHGVV